MGTAIPSKAIECLHNFFDKILVVSVPRFTDRHKQVKQNLKGLDFEFYWGSDKLKLDYEDVKANGIYDNGQAKKLQRQGRSLNLGEIACSLSHRNLYEQMIANNWQKILILEDDVLPNTEALSELGPALKELPDRWELVYLGYLKHEKVTAGLKAKQFFYKIFSYMGLMTWSYKMVCNLLPKPYSKHLRKAGFHDCTHAYAITIEAAKKLNAAQSPVVYRADDLLSATILKGEINAFVTEPKFFDQQIFRSTNAVSQIRE